MFFIGKKNLLGLIICSVLFSSPSLEALGDKARSKPKILKAAGRVDSENTPISWKIISEALKSNHVYPCSVLDFYHDMFERLHKYEAEHYKFIAREGLVGYKIWFDLKNGKKGKFSAVRS